MAKNKHKWTNNICDNCGIRKQTYTGPKSQTWYYEGDKNGTPIEPTCNPNKVKTKKK